MSNIEIDIEALVVEGFSHYEAYKIKQALESELVFLLRRHGALNLTAEHIHLDQLKLSTINIRPGQNTARIGQQIAGAVFKHLYQHSTPVSDLPIPQSTPSAFPQNQSAIHPDF